jgi:hypothetical protein
VYICTTWHANRDLTVYICTTWAENRDFTVYNCTTRHASRDLKCRLVPRYVRKLLLFNAVCTFFNYIMVRRSYIQWDDNDVCFVLDQHAIFIVLANWNNKSDSRHVTPLDTLPRFWTIQSLLFLLNAVCLAEKQQIQIL